MIILELLAVFIAVCLVITAGRGLYERGYKNGMHDARWFPKDRDVRFDHKGKPLVNAAKPGGLR